jgi:hypothetical protein
MAKLRDEGGVPVGSSSGSAAPNVVRKPGNVLDIINDEMDSQNQAVHATDTGTRKKYGPAADHFGGNPTTGGGINRPARGRV